MKALRFHRFGDVDALEVEDVAAPEPRPGEVLVRVGASGLNPSDVKNVAGAFAQTTLPRVPGRDFAGIVVAGPPELMGKRVWGTAGDLGFTRDGAHAELVAVPIENARPYPAKLNAYQAAAAGVPFVTAWAGVVELAEAQPGEWVLVTGASGAVGMAVVEIAHCQGAKVIGVDKRTAAPDTPKVARPDVFLDAAEDVEKAVLRTTGGAGANVLFDSVSGGRFEQHLKLVAPRGRAVVIASAGGTRVSFDMLDFYRRELRLFGLNSVALEPATTGRILDALAAAFDSGVLEAPRIADRVPLAEARRAYEAVARGKSGGKIVIKMM
jgi:NADPH:quinone reductase-like Zn-dependent oxidoreductase